MGINVIGVMKRTNSERANWIARVWAYAYRYVDSHWSEDQRVYNVSWGNKSYYCYEVRSL